MLPLKELLHKETHLGAILMFKLVHEMTPRMRTVANFCYENKRMINAFIKEKGRNYGMEVETLV